MSESWNRTSKRLCVYCHNLKIFLILLFWWIKKSPRRTERIVFWRLRMPRNTQHFYIIFKCIHVCFLILLLTKDAHSFSVYVKGSRMIKTIFSLLFKNTKINFWNSIINNTTHSLYKYSTRSCIILLSVRIICRSI